MRRDFFLAYHYSDQPTALDLADTLADRGMDFGPGLEVWPEMRLLPRIDMGLVEHRFAVVLVTREFLKLSWPPKELDGLAARRRVVCLLHGVAETDVAEYSPKLAVAAIPGAMTDAFGPVAPVRATWLEQPVSQPSRSTDSPRCLAIWDGWSSGPTLPRQP